jgi:hypothetical protein
MTSKFYMWWDRHFMLLELGLSFIPSLFVLFALYLVPSSTDAINEWYISSGRDFINSLPAISATMLGFIITGVSIIVAFFTGTNERLEALKGNPQYGQLFNIYFSTIKYLGLATVIFIMALFIPSAWAALFTVVVLWAVSISIVRIGRCIWVLRKLVNISGKK